ncbi:hypothetical protein SDC9_145585 [bioreactor metagenome]|uniref:Uncharacterized protein n=1 Tax=bioreactor metagenome TaxID=1076179 RepID=A0A645EAI7_9ZZZZ
MIHDCFRRLRQRQLGICFHSGVFFFRRRPGILVPLKRNIATAETDRFGDHHILDLLEFLLLGKRKRLWQMVLIGAKDLVSEPLPLGVDRRYPFVLRQLIHDLIYQLLKRSFQVTVLFLPGCMLQPLRQPGHQILNDRINAGSCPHLLQKRPQSIPAFGGQRIPPLRLFGVNMEQILLKNFPRETASHCFDGRFGNVALTGIDGIDNHVAVRMVALVMKSGVPAEIFRRDLHLLREDVPLLAQERHPRGGVVVAEPGGVLPP